ncbi:hypothetical protein MM326_17455 [Alkalihalobacillus sp. LMS6]|uniref:hypothetical protein n=1 Tax=Alkalihalobacillus sp. LMS6 TaxID=2924034 RepID=UPI0020D1E6B4|nr:hypothetical protein [Alkalihalobacillus sp. LMS6]UTR05843.1 hypothetical protein MM326_17455 [Alkalihalobacillus sp. LMS6]
MGRTIGNVALLDLTEATEESIASITHIKNVALLLYTAETAALVPKLSIGNLAQSLKIKENMQVINGYLTVDNQYLEHPKINQVVIVNGVLVFKDDIQFGTIKKSTCAFIVNGVVYAPTSLKGAVAPLITKQSGTTLGFNGPEPKIMSGTTHLTTEFVKGLPDQTTLLCNGEVIVDENLDLDVCREKLDTLFVNGKIELYEHHVSTLLANATVNGTTHTIPTNFKRLEKTFHLSNRSIKRFKQAKVYTASPLIFEKDVTRDSLDQAFTSIHSHSFIFCHEDVEDLIYEKLDRFETDVYTYSDQFLFIEKDTWHQERFSQLKLPTTILVNQHLTIEDPISSQHIQDHSIILLGDISVADQETKTVIQEALAENKGRIKCGTDIQENTNYAELSL